MTTRRPSRLEQRQRPGCVTLWVRASCLCHARAAQAACDSYLAFAEVNTADPCTALAGCTFCALISGFGTFFMFFLGICIKSGYQ